MLPWPTNNGAWRAMGAAGTNYIDGAGDVQPSAVDIVGDAVHPAGFWTYSDNGAPGTNADDAVMFRIRVNGNPAPLPVSSSGR